VEKFAIEPSYGWKKIQITSSNISSLPPVPSDITEVYGVSIEDSNKKPSFLQ